MREQDNLGRGTAVNDGEPRHGGIDGDPVGAKIATVDAPTSQYRSDIGIMSHMARVSAIDANTVEPRSDMAADDAGCSHIDFIGYGQAERK